MAMLALRCALRPTVAALRAPTAAAAAQPQRRWASGGYGPSSFDLGPRRLPDGLSDADVAAYLRWTLGKVYNVRRNPRQAEELTRALRADLRRLKEKGYEVGNAAYTQAVTLLARWGREHDARDTLDEMKRKNLIENSEAYEELIKAYAIRGDMGMVQSVVKEMQQMRLRITRQAYNYVLLGFARRGERKHAVALLDVMREQSIHPDRQSYHFAMQACQNYEDARVLFDEMGERGIQYNDHSFDALLRVCVKSGNAEAATEVLTESTDFGMKPSAVIFNQVLRLHLKPLNFGAVAQLYRAMREQGVPPDFVTYCTFIRACKLGCTGDAAADAKPVAIAEAALEQARADGVDHREVYREILSMYTKVGARGKAEEVAGAMLQAMPGDARARDVYS